MRKTIRTQIRLPVRACRRACVVVAGLLSASQAWAIAPTEDPDAAPAPVRTHMDETLRGSLRKVVVLPTSSPAGKTITGSYKDETDGLAGGMSKGADIGKGVGTDIGGIPVNIPIPILTLPGAIVGGISGKTKQEIQEFRDGLTKQLADAADQPLNNDALASDVFWGIRKVPGIDSRVLALSAPIPEDTEAVLYVNLNGVTIDVQGKEAIITTSAHATVRRLSDGGDIYEKDVVYIDRDTLGNWNRNDHALWRDYANFARLYIAREISAEVYGRTELRHELEPGKTKSVALVKKDPWRGVSKTRQPTLAWNLELHEDRSGISWVGDIETTAIAYDLEIYDRNRPVYSATNLTDATHTIEEALEPCKTYRWSVRPSYATNGEKRFGRWMRAAGSEGNGNIGRAASVAPAYLQDFASLEIKCNAR